MLSAVLFGLLKQPNTYTPTTAVGGIRLPSGSADPTLARMRDERMGWSDSPRHLDTVDIMLLAGGGQETLLLDSSIGFGAYGEDRHNITDNDIAFVTNGAVSGAFYSNRIGQSRSRKRRYAP